MGYQDHVIYNGTRYDFRDTGARTEIGELKSAIGTVLVGKTIQEQITANAKAIGDLESDLSKSNIVSSKNLLTFSPNDFANGFISTVDGAIITQGALQRIYCAAWSMPYDTIIETTSNDVRMVIAYKIGDRYICTTNTITQAFIPANVEIRIGFAYISSKETPGIANILDLLSNFGYSSEFYFDLLNEKAKTSDEYTAMLLSYSRPYLYRATNAEITGFSSLQYETYSAFKFPYDITITPLEGYTIDIKKFADKQATNFVSRSGWKNVAVTVNRNTYFTLSVHANSEFPPKDVVPILVSGIEENTAYDGSYTKDVKKVVGTYYNTVSLNDYIRRNIYKDMSNSYVNNGQVVSTPRYIGLTSCHIYPFDIVVNFDGLSFKYVSYNSDDIGDVSFNSEWSASPKVIRKNTYFTLHAQDDSNIVLDVFEPRFTITLPPAIEVLNDDIILPKKSIGEYGIQDTFNLVHFSDIHAGKWYLKRIVEYINWHENEITDTICTGDLVADTFADDFSYWNTNGGQNILLSIGNHDRFSGNDFSIANDQVYDKYFSANIDNWNVIHSGKNLWYYKIYQTPGVMLIVIDACTFYDSSVFDDQYNFLVSSLSTAKDQGLSVICANHYSVKNPVSIECSFTSIGYLPSDMLTPQRYIDAVQNFKNNGGKFICWIAGHTHANWIGYDQQTQQLCLTVDTALRTAGMQANIIRRDQTTRMCDCFNFYTFDTDKKIVGVQRIGANKDKWMRKIDSISINYETLDIV